MMLKHVLGAALCFACQAASRPGYNEPDPEAAAQPSIGLKLYSLLPVHERFQATSNAGGPTAVLEQAAPLPRVYVPATLGINVDVTRGAAGAAVLAHLNDAWPADGVSQSYNARLAEWHLCYAVVAATGGSPGSSSPTGSSSSSSSSSSLGPAPPCGCRPLGDTGSVPLPVLHGLRGGEVREFESRAVPKLGWIFFSSL
jgi:hypothetical protein